MPEESLLYKAAVTWNGLCNYKYSFTYGFKRKLYTINLSFSKSDFPHLAGFQYLRDISLSNFSPSRYVDRILEGKISQEQIEKGIQYEKMVKPRLLALISFEEILDQEFILYSFVARFAPFTTQLKADYLIASHIHDVTFIFMMRQGERNVVCDCVCSSAFIKEERDFEKNQRPYALLKKSKIRLSDNNQDVLFVKPGFEDPDAAKTDTNE